MFHENNALIAKSSTQKQNFKLILCMVINNSNFKSKELNIHETMKVQKHVCRRSPSIVRKDTSTVTSQISESAADSE